MNPISDDVAGVRLTRYQFQFKTSFGQPFYMTHLWVPESPDWPHSWGDLFDGPPPVAGQSQQLWSKLRPNNPCSPDLVIVRS